MFLKLYLMRSGVYLGKHIDLKFDETLSVYSENKKFLINLNIQLEFLRENLVNT